MKNFPQGRTRLPQPSLNPHSSPNPVRKSCACVLHKTGHTGSVDIKEGFSQCPKRCHRPICPTNRVKKPMPRTLHRPPPLVQTLDWRAWRRRRRRRRRRGAHPTGQLGETAGRRLLQMRADVGLKDAAMHLLEGRTALRRLPVPRVRQRPVSAHGGERS